MVDPVLDRLRQRERVSGNALALDLGLTRAAVHKRIVALRRLGYQIDGISRLGYRLANAPDVVDGAALPAFCTSLLHRHILPSAQDEAKALALSGAQAGTLVLADQQTAGRGRLGRTWESPLGGLWFSLILRPPIAPADAPGLPLVAALEWANALGEWGVEVALKWPNDLWVGMKKLGGILTEMSAETDQVHWMVLGIGLNVANDPPRGAIALRQAMESAPSRSLLLARWLERFQESYQHFLKRGFPPFQAGYNRRLLLRGRRVGFDWAGQRRTGTALAVDSAGRLQIKTNAGVESFAGGEVSLVRAHG